MRRPTYEVAECPTCKRKCNIPISKSWAYFLADTQWSCPHCKDMISTAEIQDHNDKKDANHA